MKLLVLLLGIALVFSAPMKSYADEWGGSNTEAESDELDQPIEDDSDMEKVVEPAKKEVKKEKKKLEKPEKKKKIINKPSNDEDTSLEDL